MIMKQKVAAFLLCFLVCFGLPIPVSAQDPAFSFEIALNEPVYLNGTATVQIKLADLAVPLSGVEFTLNFDKAFLEPVITENQNDEMNAFLKKSPQNGWEQICRYDESSACYILRFSAPDGAEDDDALVQTVDDLLIEIPFTAKTEGETAVAVADSGVIGVDKNLNLLSGIGAEKKFAVVLSDKILLKPTSSLTLHATGDAAFLTGIREEAPVSELQEHFINFGLTYLDAEGNPYSEPFCGTGMRICLFSGDTLLDSVTVVVKGDLDGDGSVSSIDCLLIKRYILGNAELNEAQLQAGYIGDEDEISSLTVLLLKRHILGNYNLYQ